LIFFFFNLQSNLINIHISKKCLKSLKLYAFYEFSACEKSELNLEFALLPLFSILENLIQLPLRSCSAAHPWTVGPSEVSLTSQERPNRAWMCNAFLALYRSFLYPLSSPVYTLIYLPLNLRVYKPFPPLPFGEKGFY